MLLREAVPEVAFTVIVYVPAGVPVVVVVDLVLEPQPNCKAKPARNNPSSNDINIFLRRESATPPNPRKANPENGNQVARNRRFLGRSSVVVVTWAVVLSVSTRLCAPVVRLVIGLLMNSQEPPVGRPAPQASETLSGKLVPPLGVTVTL